MIGQMPKFWNSNEMKEHKILMQKDKDYRECAKWMKAEVTAKRVELIPIMWDQQEMKEWKMLFKEDEEFRKWGVNWMREE